MGWRCDIATNLAIDDELICAAKELGHHKTKKEAVTAALEDYVRRMRIEGLLRLQGTVDFWDDFDPRELRNRDLRRIPELDADADSD